MNNPFLLLEGTHGAGKTTLSNILAKEHQFKFIRTPPIEYDILRSYIHESACDISRFLFYMTGNLDASHAISKELYDHPVVCDRYVPSTIVSSHINLNLPIQELIDVSTTIANHLVKPSHTVLLTTDIETRLVRLKKIQHQRKSYELNMDIEAIQREDNLLLTILQDHNLKIINTTTLKIPEVIEQILSFCGTGV